MFASSPMNQTPGAQSQKRNTPDGLDSDENPRKAPKVSRACDTCKAKKVRCTGTKPCERCAKSNLTCIYNARYSRGRLRTPPAIPTSAERVAEPERHQYTRYVSELNDAAHHDGNISRNSPGLDLTEIEGQYHDSTSGLSFLHRAWKRLSSRGNHGELGSSSTIKSQPLMQAGDQALTVPVDQKSSIPRLHRATHKELLSFYFDYCVVTYRMFHRPTVEGWLEAALVAAEGGGTSWPEAVGNARAAILLGTFAVAVFRKKRAETSSSRQEKVASRESDEYFSAATRLTDTEIGVPMLESVQSRLVQVLYLLQSSRMNQAWYLFGSTLQIVSALGLHRRSSYSRRAALSTKEPSNIVLECRKRTFWVAYTLDRYLGVVFGRPRHYHDDDINQDLPTPINDEDLQAHTNLIARSTDDCHIDSSIAYAELARIIGNISRDVYSVKNLDTDARARYARQYTDTLYKWKFDLPAHLGSVKPSSLIHSFKRQAIALKLAFFHAVIHANRPFLLMRADNAADREVSEGSIEYCLLGARNVLEIFKFMSEDANLYHAYWWTTYVVFTALTVTYAWEIQQHAKPNRSSNRYIQSYQELFELAEDCHTLLSKTIVANSPSQRYKVILEELKIEATQRPSSQPNDRRNGNEGHAEGSHLGQAGASSSSPFDSSATALNESEYRSAPAMFSNWHSTDWLDLDSSAFDISCDLFQSPV